MKFIVEENCYNNEVVMKWIPFLKPLLDAVLNQQKLSSLDYFVIADSTERNYRDTVLKYASLVDTEAHVTQDSHYVTVDFLY